MPEIFAVDQFTDKEVNMGQTPSGSIGSRIKASGTCSSVSAPIVRSLGLCSGFTICARDHEGICNSGSLGSRSEEKLEKYRGHFLESPVDEKDHERSHPEKYRGHDLKSPVDEKVFKRIHP
jgi:hypothetical protein